MGTQPKEPQNAGKGTQYIGGDNAAKTGKRNKDGASPGGIILGLLLFVLLGACARIMGY